MKSVEIIVAAHKKYDFPKGGAYIPLQVGAKIATNDLKIARDDTGDNISEKNPYFCELTGLYWLWKNSKANYKGLVHYRRYFTAKTGNIKKTKRLEAVLSDSEIENLINNYDIILPKKRNYYIESLWSHYGHTLHLEPLEKTGEIIKKDFPEYYKEFERLKTRKSAHMFNMFIAKKEIFDEYSEWLFKILFKLEKELKDSPEFMAEYSGFHSRFYGRISELLFDVWLYTKYPGLKTSDKPDDEVKVKELRVLDIENINWLKKGGSFLLAKFTGRKYEKSF
jgi:hypothetical protein